MDPPVLANGSDIDKVTEQLDAAQLDSDEHWEGFWDDAFAGVRGKNLGYHGEWQFHKDDTMTPTSNFTCIRSYKRSANGQSIEFHNLFEQKPTKGRSKQRPDGLHEHKYVRQLSEPYFSSCQIAIRCPVLSSLDLKQPLRDAKRTPDGDAISSAARILQCNMQLAPSEKADGKPACFYWRSVPISGAAVSRLQPSLPPLTEGPLPPIPNADYATAIWAMEGYLQDGENRWSLGPIYSLQNLHLLTHMFIREYATSVDPSGNVSFAEQPMSEARGKLNADPTTWMDDGTWEGTMTDMLWDEDGELFKCNPRPAQWGPPAIVTGRKSVDTLLALKRLFLYPDMMYGYYPERLPATADAARQRRGVRLEIGGMMRRKKEFRRVVLSYNPTGEVASLTEEVYHPPS